MTTDCKVAFTGPVDGVELAQHHAEKEALHGVSVKTGVPIGKAGGDA